MRVTYLDGIAAIAAAVHDWPSLVSAIVLVLLLPAASLLRRNNRGRMCVRAADS